MPIETVPPPAAVLRVARADGAARFSWISPADNRSAAAGNRYDVVGGGVLYAADEVQTCLRETLARFRPTPKMRQLLRDADPDEPGFMIVGGVPQDWRLQRRVFTLSMDDDALPFVDVEKPTTLQALEEELSAEHVSLGYVANLDLGDVRNRDRRLSRAIAAWAYTAQDDTGEPLYSGIRYHSRVDDSKICWAIFDGTTVRVKHVHSIELDNADLQHVCQD